MSTPINMSLSPRSMLKRQRVAIKTRAREPEKFEVPNPSFQEIWKQYGGPNLSDEEILSRYHAGPKFVDALKTAPPRKEYLDARKPLVKLVEELVNRQDAGYFYIRRDAFMLSAGRRT